MLALQRLPLLKLAISRLSQGPQQPWRSSKTGSWYLSQGDATSDRLTLLRRRRIAFSKIRAVQDGIFIQPTSDKDFRRMSKFPKEMKYPLHTFCLHAKRPLRSYTLMLKPESKMWWDPWSSLGKGRCLGHWHFLSQNTNAPFHDGTRDGLWPPTGAQEFGNGDRETDVLIESTTYWPAYCVYLQTKASTHPR